jgi:glyceraldehyde-3-phosphate dehydrogenase (NADP+)
MTVLERIQCVQRFTEGLQANKPAIVNMLMWEICKSRADATKEVDRTIEYIRDTIRELKKSENSSSQFVHDGGILGTHAWPTEREREDSLVCRSRACVSLCC